MLKKMLIVSSIAGLPLVNEYVKTQIIKTKVFKQTIIQINQELN